jgi:hypothetical protein
MIFLTYNDAPDGIYQSQVIDVCRYWEDTFKQRVRLIAFISLRDFFVNKAKIRAAYSDSIVLPMFPGIENWGNNVIRINVRLLFHKKETVIARGVFATLLAIKSGRFKKVCFDARGAYAAEWSEYLSKDSPTLAGQMKELEKQALLKSDFRIAISQKLVDYWKENYAYNKTEHVVIPCALNSSNEEDTIPRTEIRKQLQVRNTETLLVYSGSSAQWQSFNTLEENLSQAFAQNANIKLLMLCKPGGEKALAEKYPGRVMQAWVKPYEVSSFLNACDYGLLVREQSVTNKVSSPVKFAEYLAAGLPVIISEGIGDYSNFVKEKNCGRPVNTIDWSKLSPVIETEKARISEIAKTYFTKQVYLKEYTRIQQL